jgi:peptidoglycan endopeptidase LytF
MNRDPLYSHTKEDKYTGYTLKEKETLFDLLRRFDMNILELKKANPGLDIYTLKPGQTLAVRKTKGSLEEPCKGYVLKHDEDLSSVSQKFNQSVVALLKANPSLRPLEIREGIYINLPE